MRHTECLVELGKKFIFENNIKNLAFAFVGGSVGRGDADEFSDLDLNIYTVDKRFLHENIEFRGNIIQLQIEPVPKLETVLNYPWEFRFLQESRVLYDPDNIFHDLQSEAFHFFKSRQGKDLLKSQWKEVVNNRITWAVKSINREEWITAGVAAKSAWIDAGLGYLYFAHGSLATGELLSVIREFDKYDYIRNIVFGYPPHNTQELLNIIKNYRSYLYQNYGKHFELEPIQDKLISRKIERYKEAMDFENIIFHAYGEAFGCILSIEESFEIHLSSLPIEHREGLRLLGFRTYDEQEIKTVCKQAEEIKNMIVAD